MPGTSEIVRLETSQRLSRVITHAGTVYLSGITAVDGGADIRGQTVRALEKLDAYLAQAGIDKTRLLSVQIWLKDIERDFDGMNDVWNAWTPKGAAPTRATGESRLSEAAALIELIAVAAA